MADLTNKSPATTYKDLLTVNVSSSDNEGLETTLKRVSDGEGVASAIELSSNDINISTHNASSTGLKLGGTLVTSGATNLNAISAITSLDTDLSSVSSSDDSLASAKSIKAYVDAQVTAQDLDVTSDSGTIAIDLDSETLTIAGGEGIDTSATSNSVTIAAEDATTSNKGVASFSSDHFGVSSGAVTLKADGIDDTLIDFGTGTNQVDTDVIPEGSSNLFYTDERVDDRVNTLITDGEGITTTYNDGSNTLTIDCEDATSSNKGVASFSTSHFSVSSGAVSIATDSIDDTLIDFGTGTNQVNTDDLPEGSTNLYVTNERIDDRVNALATAGEGIDITYDDSAGTLTFAGEDATTSNKGIASFSSDNFAVSSGAVTIKDNGVILATETTGDYVQNITGGTGIDSTGATSGENIAHTLSLNLNELTTETTIADADFIAMVDATDSASGKITFENLEDAIFASVSGDIAIAEDGAATIQANSVALATDTTGNYVATVADSGTGGITVSNSGSENAGVTLEFDINGLTAAAIASGDQIAFSDEGTAGDPSKKESIDDIATLFAGTGLTASSAVIGIDAAQTGITSLLAADIKIGEDDETKIDFETANEIHFYANNVEQVYLGDNIFGPQSDSDVDLGATGTRWKDAYIDTITTSAETIQNSGNALLQVISESSDGDSVSAVTLSRNNNSNQVANLGVRDNEDVFRITVGSNVGASYANLGDFTRFAINANGSSLFNSSVGVGRVGANNISVADDGTIALTDNDGAISHIYIYERGSGAGAIYTVGYPSATAIVLQGGGLTFTDGTAESDGNVCLFSSVNNHAVTFKNMTGATKNFRIMMVGAGHAAPI
jgi:hypothetical protein